jgi:hypothetical protein
MEDETLPTGVRSWREVKNRSALDQKRGRRILRARMRKREIESKRKKE